MSSINYGQQPQEDSSEYILSLFTFSLLPSLTNLKEKKGIVKQEVDLSLFKQIRY